MQDDRIITSSYTLLCIKLLRVEQLPYNEGDFNLIVWNFFNCQTKVTTNTIFTRALSKYPWPIHQAI